MLLNAEHMANLQGQPLTSIFVDPWITAVEPAVAAKRRQAVWRSMDLVAPWHHGHHGHHGTSAHVGIPEVPVGPASYSQSFRKNAWEIMEIMEAVHRVF